LIKSLAVSSVIIIIPPFNCCLEINASVCRGLAFLKIALSVNEIQVLSILTVYSRKGNSFYTKLEGDINVIDMV
jgi:hypothetical protein